MSEIPRIVAVSDQALYAAFAKGRADGRFEIDALRFEEFQRGWNEALEFINAYTLSHYPNDTKEAE